MHNLEFQQRTIDSIFLEVLDDLSKKEVLLMILCYMQLVRRENTFEVPLSDLIRCSEKPYKHIKGDWRDIMMELDIFYIIDDDRMYEGKDIFKVQNISQSFVSIANIYKPDFQNISTTIAKYWNIVSKLASFNDGNPIEKKISTVVLLFNEQLYKECILYSNMLRERALSFTENMFFDAIIDVSFCMEFYQKDLLDRAKDYCRSSIDKLSEINNFYELNLKDFIKQLDVFFKKPQKSQKFIPKIHTNRQIKKKNFFSNLINKIKKIFT